MIERHPKARVFQVRRFLALPLVVAIASCAFEDDDGTRDFEEAPTGEVSSELVSYDCTTRSDTGYTNGKAFAITVVTVDGKPVEEGTANAFLTMAKAAEGAGINLRINSGFRTMKEQEYFYGCYINKNCNNGNLAAKPGYSNHQSGHALDLNTGGGALGWLNAHGAAHGFKRTVPSEDWHWEWWGGGNPQNYCGNKAPQGYLDAASCDAVTGWAFDPEAGAGAIATHLYFNGPAGAAGAVGVPTTANQPRSDLCAVVGSCDHGYTLRTPLSLHDGAGHAVHAYGIDSAGGGNPQLGNSPRELKCEPKLPAGVTRWIENPTVLGAWKLDAFHDQLPIPKATIDAIPRGPNVPAAPVLAKADGGDKVYLLDGKQKRHIGNPDIMDAWRFAWAAIQVKPAAEIAALPEGKPVRTRPVMVADSAGRLLLIDDGEPEAPPTNQGGAGGATGTAGSSSGTAGSTGTAVGGASSSSGGSSAGGNGAGAGSASGGASGTASSAGRAGSGSGVTKGGAAGATASPTGRPASIEADPPDESEANGACAIVSPGRDERGSRDPFALASVFASVFALRALATRLRRRR